jgi:hypothetical protein
MTKKGYKNKFVKLFATLTAILFVLFLITSGNISLGAILGQLVLSGIYVFIPATLVTGVWEFFEEK